MTVLAIEWDDTAGRDGHGAVRLLDQTLLPVTTAYRVIDRVDDLVAAIAELAVRGAPALGVAGAMGVVLAMDEGLREGWGESDVSAAVDAKMLLQVHDELVVEAERSDLEQVARLLTSSMSNAYQISVPLTTEVSYGQNWDDQTELNLN